MSEDFYSLAHPHYYEHVDRFRFSDEYAKMVRGLLPLTWSTKRSGPWLMVWNGVGVKQQGFKIHVSSTQANAERTLRLVAAECIEHDVTFKVAGDHVMLQVLNGRAIGRGNAGKFMTIYPPTEGVFRSLIERLYESTRDTDLAGAYVLSDRRYKDSRLLSYRFGGFTPLRQLRVDGTSGHYLRAPDGRFVADARLPYFELPAWITDPFPAEASNGSEDAPLKQRYRVLTALKFSNCGGVYQALDEHTGHIVIVKEARPYTGEFNLGGTFTDARALLEWEWTMLKRLSHLECVPQAIDFFKEWEHSFLVMELVPGATLWAFWATREHLFAPYVCWPGALDAFLPRFKGFALSLLDAIEAVHSAGVIINDLSTRNVMIDPATLRVRLIDFEAAVAIDTVVPGVTDVGLALHTPGFRNPDRKTRGFATPTDDFYAAGMLLYTAIAPAQEHFTLNPASREVFLDGMVRLGVPDAARSAIRALFRGEPDEARRVLHTINPETT